MQPALSSPSEGYQHPSIMTTILFQSVPGTPTRPNTSSLPKGSVIMAAPSPHPTVLLTGGNGFIASHILSQLISAGYAVTATLRSPSKAQALLTTHPEWEDKVKFDYVPELTATNAFDAVFEKAAEGGGGFDYVIHTASPVTFVVQDVERDLVEPAVKG